MLKEKIYVMTGIASQRKLSLVEKYAKQGCAIAFMDVNKEAGFRLKKEIEDNYGVSVFFFHGNVKSEEDRDLFLGAIEGMYGSTEGLFVLP